MPEARSTPAGLPQLRALGVAQASAEMQQRPGDVVGLEIIPAAIEVDESAGRELPVFVEDEPDSPATALDCLATGAALGLAARRALGSADTRQAPVRALLARRLLEALMFRDRVARLREALEQRFRSLVGGTERMKPDRHLSIGERIRQPLAESQLAARDRHGAAAALGAPACGRLEDVGHPERIAPISQGRSVECLQVRRHAAATLRPTPLRTAPSRR